MTAKMRLGFSGFQMLCTNSLYSLHPNRLRSRVPRTLIAVMPRTKATTLHSHSTLLMNRNRSIQSLRCIFSSIASGKQSLKPFSNNCFVYFPATMTKESSPNRPRRFAPLNPEKQTEGEDLGPWLKGIVFDVDGTLCECFLSLFYSVKCRPSFFRGYKYSPLLIPSHQDTPP